MKENNEGFKYMDVSYIRFGKCMQSKYKHTQNGSCRTDLDTGALKVDAQQEVAALPAHPRVLVLQVRLQRQVHLH